MPAFAQSSGEGRGFVGVKTGMNIENAEDGLRGRSRAIGAMLALGLQRTWMPEIEFWYPGFFGTNQPDGRHRDIVGSLAFRRTLGSGRARPYFSVGFSVAQTTTTFTSCGALRHPPGSTTVVRTLVSCSEPDVIERIPERFTSTSTYGLGGAGVDIAMGRVRLLPDVRVDVSVTSVLVRPSIGVALVF
jgi:hypothetical protein